MSLQSYTTFFTSPLGLIEITGTNDFVTSVLFCGTKSALTNTDQIPQIVHKCEQELKEYFAGSRKTFTVPYKQKGTNFQQQVWQSLENIPYGTTWSYGQQAESINRPKAVRAIGGINGKNQLTIIVPCHRVIGKDGSLTGYGGEIWRKKWLLEHEKKFKIQNLRLEV